ncbi:hypothetical protein A2U01_0116179, partial [Trifolium medium]|nr:hypothetical protein [Trifolium medium]
GEPSLAERVPASPSEDSYYECWLSEAQRDPANAPRNRAFYGG